MSTSRVRVIIIFKSRWCKFCLVVVCLSFGFSLFPNKDDALNNDHQADDQGEVEIEEGQDEAVMSGEEEHPLLDEEEDEAEMDEANGDQRQDAMDDYVAEPSGFFPFLLPLT